eukprot:TRINITY_DN4810_c0_g2_i4.p1 TRINITY_DN4810_c0_g2~~TRINITY_DN4810_c0_g2_i4.p1  ORF type:complete len:1187 (-),score=216.62 TRINITY_DN4810_c0_g2_i4:1538-5098(-)
MQPIPQIWGRPLFLTINNGEYPENSENPFLPILHCLQDPPLRKTVLWRECTWGELYRITPEYLSVFKYADIFMEGAVDRLRFGYYLLYQTQRFPLYYKVTYNRKWISWKWRYQPIGTSRLDEFYRFISVKSNSLNIDLENREHKSPLLQQLLDSTCDISYIEELSVKNHGLATIDKKLLELVNLRYMCIDGNCFAANFDWLLEFPLLESLSLRDNYLEEFPIGLELENLKVLVLDDNNIQTFTTDVVNMVNLRELSLSNNNIISVDISFLLSMPRLSKLNLSNNAIISIPDNLKILVELKYLDMSHNQIQVIPESFYECSLRSIKLGNNEISVIPENIVDNQTLEYLGFENNLIHHLSLDITIWLSGRRRDFDLANNPLPDNFFVTGDSCQRLSILNDSEQLLNPVRFESISSDDSSKRRESVNAFQDIYQKSINEQKYDDTEFLTGDSDSGSGSIGSSSSASVFVHPEKKRRRRGSIKSVMKFSKKKKKKRSRSGSQKLLPIVSSSTDIMFIGPPRCGKTSIINRYIDRVFNKNTYPSKTEDTRIIMEGNHMLTIYDPQSSLFENKSLLKEVFDKNMTYVIVFDLSNSFSFDEVKIAMREYCSIFHHIVLVGSKCDIKKKFSKKKHINVLCNKYNCKYFEVSSKNSIGINDLFYQLFEMTLKSVDRTKLTDFDEISKDIKQRPSSRSKRKNVLPLAIPERKRKSKTVSPRSGESLREKLTVNKSKSGRSLTKHSRTNSRKKSFLSLSKRSDDSSGESVNSDHTSDETNERIYDETGVIWNKRKSGKSYIKFIKLDTWIRAIVEDNEPHMGQVLAYSYPEFIDPVEILKKFIEIYFGNSYENKLAILSFLKTLIVSNRKILEITDIYIIMNSFLNDSMRDTTLKVDELRILGQVLEEDSISESVDKADAPNPYLPMNLHNSQLDIFDFHPAEIARQITIHDHHLFRLITKQKLLEFNLDNFENENNCQNIKNMISSFNDLSSWLMTLVITSENLERRTMIINRFIHIATHLHKLQNYNSLLAIVSALQNIAITRLIQSWIGIPQRSLKKLEKLIGICNIAGNFIKMRRKWKTSEMPTVPYIGAYIQDLLLLREIETIDETHGLNFEKLKRLHQIYFELKYFKKKKYNLFPVDFIQHFLYDDNQFLDEDTVFEESLRIETQEKNREIKDSIKSGETKVHSLIKTLCV